MSKLIIIIMLLKNRFQILKGYQNNHVTIGFGSYGQVKLARDLQTTNIVAVKINKIAKNQVMMHNGLSHPKIIKLIDVYIDVEREITYMILEYADGGTLFQKIKMGAVSKKDVRKYFRDVCQALAYLHSQNIMHRDIKPQNVLLTKNNEAKLCDFGFAAILGERKTLCGTYEYMSPEMIQNRPYDYKIDIWALGILLFELISGHAPFRGDKPEEVLEQMKTKIYFCQRFDVEDINLIKTILRVTPNKRPTIGEILEQPFFSEENHSEQKDQTTHSTTNTQDTKAKNASLQYLSESCNPKKMAQIQKTLEREHQKQTYPPFYVPKAQHKFGVGVTIPYQSKQIKGHSPMHYQKTNPNISLVTGSNLNSTYYKPPSQAGTGTSNKSFSGLLSMNKSPTYQQQVPQTSPTIPGPQSQSGQSFQSQTLSFLNGKPNIGFGRYS